MDKILGEHFNFDEAYKTGMSVVNGQVLLESNDPLETLGALIDASEILNKKNGFKHAIKLGADLFKSSQLKLQDEPLLHYFMANAWSGIEQKGAEWRWEQHEKEKQIIHLRKAIIHIAFKELEPVRQCQIFTNLGSIFSFLGRFVEAQSYWDQALKINPFFGMALVNKTMGLNYYANTTFDKGHRTLFYKEALKYIKKAFLPASDPLEPYEAEFITNYFKNFALWMEQFGPLKRIRSLKFSLGRSKGEREYRKWCLINRLFVNPLNDLGSYSIAATDVLTAPSIKVSVGEGPFLHGFFDQLKQEFVSARFLFYEGTHTKKTSYSDKDVHLYDTLDFPSYGLNIEKIKIAFRSCYSIFDKISFFINEYLKLSIPQNRVTFRTLWYKSQNRKLGLASQFKKRENLPLRGLFWLSKDFFEKKEGFRDYLEPNAKDWQEIRNQLEHKYLKLHEYDWVLGEPDSKSSVIWKGKISKSLLREDFEEKTIKLIQLTRVALIYLSLTIYVEEEYKNKEESIPPVPMPLNKYEDDWKR